ncbi:hypothetical protein OG871_23985 [Kitasatospora sp. NBC_00374]|uniref:hypothetical protein n=1 Tax=Kitasatospora sp. NBC_00374 TaxID=2975964 RepID=UPI00324670BB
MAEPLGRPDVIPYIAAWSTEHFVHPDVVLRPGVGIAYRDENPYDRDPEGVLWARMTLGRGRGRPEFGRIHSGRQRRAMRRLLCQICGGPADRDRNGVLWLLKDDRDDWPDWPEGLAATHPPVSRPCARVAVRLCPHLRGGATLVRVKDHRECGVYGTLYRPGPPRPRPVLDVVVASHERRARLVLAAQMLRVLRDRTLVDLDDTLESAS